MRRSGCPCSHRQKEKAFLKSMRNNLRDQSHVLRRAAGKCPTGISPLANIPSPCAWKASFPIFGRGMRTQAPASRHFPDSARGIGKKRNRTSCDVRQGSILREFRRWRKGTNEKSKAFQPCFILLSIVMHDAVSILRILPQRLRCRLKVLSSILPEEKINLSQLSVSAHSFRAISNLDSISARL